MVLLECRLFRLHATRCVVSVDMVSGAVRLFSETPSARAHGRRRPPPATGDARRARRHQETPVAHADSRRRPPPAMMAAGALRPRGQKETSATRADSKGRLPPARKADPRRARCGSWRVRICEGSSILRTTAIREISWGENEVEGSGLGNRCLAFPALSSTHENVTCISCVPKKSTWA